MDLITGLVISLAVSIFIGACAGIPVLWHELVAGLRRPTPKHRRVVVDGRWS